MPFELIAFAGIAQHHRVPTQLLDWSISPYSAAYFAASDAIDFRDRNDPCQSDLIHVYSLNATSLERKPRSVKSDLTMGIPNYSDVLKDTAQMIQPVSVPRASNKNFQAQSGVFTKLNTLRLDRNIFTSTGNSFVPQSYEQLLANLKHPATSICPLLFKFVLPASEASHVLWLLDKLGVNYASQFPSFDSAAKSMFESAKIRKAVFGV